MRILKLVAPAVVVTAGLFMSSALSFAKPADTKKTGQKCTVCHTSAKGGKEALTDAGKFYQQKGTLEGYTGPGADKIVKKS